MNFRVAPFHPKEAKERKMAKKKTLGSAKRLGARYGRRVRHKLAEIEALQHKAYTCPYCHAKRVKRKAVGIWHCKKCNATFSGKAYTVEKIKRTAGEGAPAA